MLNVRNRMLPSMLRWSKAQVSRVVRSVLSPQPADHTTPAPSAVSQEDIERLRESSEELRHHKERLKELEARHRLFRSGWVPCFIPVRDLLQVQPCVVCQAGSDRRYVFPYPSVHERFKGLYVLGCGACGVSWVPPGAVDLEAYYATTYASENRADRSEAPAAYFANIRSKKQYYDRARRHAKYSLLLGRPIKRVLDLGSGPGYFLHALKEREPGIEQSFAVEPDLASHKYLQHLGAEIVPWTEVASLAPLDIVLSSHSLEHYWIDQLPAVLSSVAASLAEDGLFVFEVPSADLLRTNWHYIHEPHTVFFSRDAIDCLLRSAGFQAVALIPLYDKRFPVRPDAVFTPTAYPDLEATGGIVGIASRIADDPRMTAFQALSPLRSG